MRAAVAAIRGALSKFVYVATSERQFASQVGKALALFGCGDPPRGVNATAWREHQLWVREEVATPGGRVDIVCTYAAGTYEVVSVAIELKVRGVVSAVESQVRCYARAGFDAVGLVTTNQTLAANLQQGHEWVDGLTVFCGCPYFVVPLRSF
jgi:hypothetical protein